MRQTVFDWLAPRIDGARCLDLFAGSGALGLEALSRGASLVRFVERGREQSAAIRAAIQKLGAGERAELHEADALADLARLSNTFNIVFLDPPYDSDLNARTLPLLAPILSQDNRIYIEWRASNQPELPQGFEWLREKKAGQVSFGLITYLQGELS